MPVIQGNTYKCSVCECPCYVTPLAIDLDGSQQAPPVNCPMWPADELPQPNWERIDLQSSYDEVMLATVFADIAEATTQDFKVWK